MWDVIAVERVFVISKNQKLKRSKTDVIAFTQNVNLSNTRKKNRTKTENNIFSFVPFECFEYKLQFCSRRRVIETFSKRWSSPRSQHRTLLSLLALVFFIFFKHKESSVVLDILNISRQFSGRRFYIYIHGGINTALNENRIAGHIFIGKKVE